jgi:membrane protein
VSTRRTIRRAARTRRPSPLARVVAWPVEFARDWFLGFLGLQGFDRAVALAGQAFTALIPLLIVYAAVVSRASGQDFADQLIRIFHLTGTAAANVRQAFAPPGAVESQVSTLGALLLVVSALSFTRALQRLYQLAWGQTSLGVRAAKWGLMWLVLVVLALTVRPVVLGPFHGVTKVVLTIVTSGIIWLVTPYVLLGRRVPWQRLWPTAALTGIGMTGLGLAGAVWMPHSVATTGAQFGGIGVAFAILGWLVGGGFVLVAATSGGTLIDRRLRRPSSPPGVTTLHPDGGEAPTS